MSNPAPTPKLGEVVQKTFDAVTQSAATTDASVKSAVNPLNVDGQLKETTQLLTTLAAAIHARTGATNEFHADEYLVSARHLFDKLCASRNLLIDLRAILDEAIAVSIEACRAAQTVRVELSKMNDEEVAKADPVGGVLNVCGIRGVKYPPPAPAKK